MEIVLGAPPSSPLDLGRQVCAGIAVRACVWCAALSWCGCGAAECRQVLLCRGVIWTLARAAALLQRGLGCRWRRSARHARMVCEWVCSARCASCCVKRRARQQ